MIADYNQYRFSLKEYIRYILQGMLISSIIGFLFYQSIFGVILLSPVIFFYCKKKRADLMHRRKWRLNMEFKDGITSLSAALKAGYSVENAFEEALKDLKLLYWEDSLIVREFNYINNQIRMNITAEQALEEFGERTGIEDIISFAEVFATAKRTGGDLVSIIRSASNSINDKIEVKREIITMIAAKKYEADIMKLIPPGIILFLLLLSPGFLSPLYHCISGALIMTFILGGYLAAYLMIDKISSIEV